jgi:hypothetical protein
MQFCSSGNARATSAHFVLELTGGSRGRLKVVAVDPTDPDSSRVIQSEDVTFNGGIGGTYAPAILRTIVRHEGIPLSLRAVGTELATVQAASLVAPSLSTVELTLLSVDDSSLTATAVVPSPLPAADLNIAAAGGSTAHAALLADQVLDVESAAVGECYGHHCYFVDPNPAVYPKDFAFIYGTAPNPWHGLFHLYYIRRNRNLGDVPSNESALGHTWSRDLRIWSAPDTALEFPHGTVGWDKVHVWAPTIVNFDGLFYMYYTGVDSLNNQTIGFATTSTLDTSNTVWDRNHAPAFTVGDAPSWAYDPSPQSPQECRDPFLMADPDSAGRFLMFYAAPARTDSHAFAVGLARSRPGTLASWNDLGYYPSTRAPVSGNGFTVESPTVFADSIHSTPDSASTASWRLLFAHGVNPPPDSAIRITSKQVGARLSNTALENWTAPSSTLSMYLAMDPAVTPARAIEHLKAGTVDLLASYDGYGIGVSRMYWRGRDFFIKLPVTTAVQPFTAASLQDAGLRVARRATGSATVEFEIGLPAASHAKLVVFDVAGRRIRLILDRKLPPGRTTVAWDGRDASGFSVPSGVYFAGLSGKFGIRATRVPFVR